MKITYYGHSCFAVETAGKTLLFDPFITPNELAKDIKLADIKADYILISHGHYDHIHDAVALAKQTGATTISNFEIYQWLGKQGLEKTHPLNHGGGHNFDFGYAKLLNAIHSSVLPDGTYGGNPGGFLIKTPEGSFYFAGDTALTYDMKLIPEEATLRFAFLPIGDNFTMGTRDAIRAASFLHTSQVIGMHYDTFPPIKLDHAAAINEFHNAGLHLHLINIGSSIDL